MGDRAAQKICADIISRVEKGKLPLQGGRIPTLTEVQAICKGIDRDMQQERQEAGGRAGGGHDEEGSSTSVTIHLHSVSSLPRS